MPTELTKYNAACTALAEARTVDEVKDMRDKAFAMQAYAKQAKNRQLETDAAEIRIRAERRLGEMLVEAPKNKGATGSKVTGSKREPLKDKTPTLSDMGITKKLSARSQKIAAIPAPEFEAKVAGWREKVATEDKVKADILSPETHVGHNSGENEWYTPSRYTEAASRVMGGIDCDPASSAKANETVLAKVFYTKDDDGLSQVWGKRVWMNPPYAQPLIANFCDGLFDRVGSGEVEEAIVLVNNATETAWFHRLLSIAASICFPVSRIRFLDPEGNLGAPLQGQAIIYVGGKPDQFFAFFAEFGVICNVIQ